VARRRSRAFSAFSGCLNEGQLTRPAVCESRTVESWYAVGLAVGAAIAVVGGVAGHFKRRSLIVIAIRGSRAHAVTRRHVGGQLSCQ